MEIEEKENEETQQEREPCYIIQNGTRIMLPDETFGTRPDPNANIIRVTLNEHAT